MNNLRVSVTSREMKNVGESQKETLLSGSFPNSIEPCGTPAIIWLRYEYYYRTHCTTNDPGLSPRA